MDPFYLIPISIGVFFVLFLVWAIKRRIRLNAIVKEQEMRFIEAARRIRPDMTKAEVINILGNRYTTSYLQDGVELLVWKIDIYNSVRVDDSWITQLSYTRQIGVSFKNDIAIEVRSSNMT